MKNGDFVIARLAGEKDCRQGIFIGGSLENFTILGESGSRHKCEGTASIVPDKNLFGSTKEFVSKYRLSTN